uniref:Hypoxia-inducible factor 1-alpha inhibitor n=1 Tax=Diabrotica virgifera virgifera TaxID=50390 RepID=A0A6P7F307_DIAVI
MGENQREWCPQQLRNYDFELSQIPRCHFQDPNVDELMKKNQPVVITDSNLVKSAVEKWNLDYLEQNLGKSGHTVFVSNDHRFKYFDEKKIHNQKNNPKGIEFDPPTRRVQMKVSEFMRKIRNWKEGDDRLYLQQSLNSTVGPNIVEDYLKFDWHFVVQKKTTHGWGELTSNVLFVSQEGNVTPCHYDEQQNLFAQISGFKRCILFPPDQFECLYPHPVYHPHDRQSMIDFEHPDYTKYPKFKNVKGCETILRPGDVLYIPICWWHHIESLLNEGATITVNFWYKGGPTNLEYPLQDHQKVSIMRNVEKMLLEVLQDPNEVGPLLRTMVLGRYTDP